MYRSSLQKILQASLANGPIPCKWATSDRNVDFPPRFVCSLSVCGGRTSQISASLINQSALLKRPRGAKNGCISWYWALANVSGVGYCWSSFRA